MYDCILPIVKDASCGLSARNHREILGGFSFQQFLFTGEVCSGGSET